MKITLILIVLIYNLLASNKIENYTIPLDNSFTDTEKQYILSNTVNIGMSIDNYPFSLKEENQIVGFSYDYINLIIKKSGLKINFEMDNWSNNLNKFKTKQLDLIDSISYKKNRESFTNFSKPYFELGNVIFTRKNEINNYTGLESLKGKKVGITKDMYYFDEINNLELFEIIEFTNGSDKMKALAYGKVDAIFSNLITGQKHIKQNGYSNIKILGEVDSKIIKKEDLRIGVKKEDKILFSIINKSINAITRQEKDLLLIKWFAAKVESKTIKNTINLSNNEKQYLKEKKQITMCIDPDWMPFEKFDNDGKHVGMTADYYNLFKNNLNTDIKVIRTKTWTESLEGAKSRKCDILSLSMETPNRKKYLNFTTPYLKIPIVIATKIDVPFINDMEAIKNKKVGIPKGYAFVEILKNKYSNLNIVEVKNIQEGLLKVNKDELFGFIGSLATISHQFQSGARGELKIAGKFNETWELGIGVRSDDKILFDILEKAVKSIDSQKHQQILNNWISIKYEKGMDTALIWKIFIVVLTIGLLMLYRGYVLKKSIKSLDQILDSTIEAIAIFKDDKLSKANQVFLDMYGYNSTEEILGKSTLSFVEVNQQEYLKEKLNKSKKPYEVNMIRKDNIIFPALVRDTKVANDLRVTSVLDLTELKKKDRVLLEQSKLAAMGEMIGNISHQWRQPLSVISTGATGMKLQKECGTLSDDNFNNTCDAINDNAQYLSKTIDDFKNFIKGDRSKNIFTLNDVIHSFLNLVNGSVVSSDTSVILDLHKDIKINGYDNELMQCLINIFNNSQDALLENNLKEKFIYISTFKEQSKVILKIKDNAGGIPTDVMPRIFEPYFTTKHKSKGTGLGLHMVHNLITDGMKGTIVVQNVTYRNENQEYTGAEFTIALPQR